MKKYIPTFIVSALILFPIYRWIFITGFSWQLSDLIQKIIFLIIAGFTLFFAIRRLNSRKRGEPAQDELSKKIVLKATYYAYSVSIFLWYSLMDFSNDINLPTHTIIGIGFVCMVVAFVISWIILSWTGIKNE
jgi:hypothetical protein